MPISNIYTGKEIIAVAQRNNWRYEEIPTVNYEMDISGLFDENSPTRNLMLDFLFLWLSEKLKRPMVKKFLESNIVSANDFCFDVSIIMIHLESSQAN